MMSELLKQQSPDALGDRLLPLAGLREDGLMLAFQKMSPGAGLCRREIETPKFSATEALIAVEAVGICGSDVHVFDGSPSYDWMSRSLPVTLGHELAGRIVSVGADVVEVAPGDRVTVLPDLPCGNCDHCAAGRESSCRRTRGLGFNRNGGFAQYLVAPAGNCMVLPKTVDTELAALTEPLAVGAEAVEVGEVWPGAKVVVLGAGMIALSVAMMARRAGAEVAIFGLNDEERLRCASGLGFQHVFDLTHITLKEGVSQAFGSKVERVFEATGVPESVADGLEVLVRGGILVATGIHARPLQIDLTALVRKRHQIRTSHASEIGTWARVIEMLGESGDEFRGLITHRLPLSETLEGFALAKSKAATKVMLSPHDA